MRVLLLSAYHAHSHALWVEGLKHSLPDYHWTVLSLPPRYFNWRLRGNSLSWAYQQQPCLLQDYELLIATSMCDLTGLRSFVPKLSGIPTLMYFHENQFAYPDNGHQQGRLENQITTLYSALSADFLMFNSEFNRSSFFSGVDSLLGKMPDFCPRSEIMAKLQHSGVFPVGVRAAEEAPNSRAPGQRLSVLWNHRWEYDKGPDALLAIVKACDQANLPIDFSIVGQQFRTQPPVFEALRRTIVQSQCLRLNNWGFIADDSAYQAEMSACDIVLSTSLHDFQGLSVLEAVARGCQPLLPQRLVYPEWFDARYLYTGGSLESETQAALEKLRLALQLKAKGELVAPSVAHFSWQKLASEYRRQFDRLLDSFKS